MSLRFTDAPCNPRTSFHHGKPAWGSVHRYLGLVALLITWLVAQRGRPWELGCCLGVWVLLWLVAWWQQIGNRYRCFTVAAMWLTAIVLTQLRWSAT